MQSNNRDYQARFDYFNEEVTWTAIGIVDQDLTETTWAALRVDHPEAARVVDPAAWEALPVEAWAEAQVHPVEVAWAAQVAAQAQAADQAEVAWGAVVPQAAPVVVAHLEVGLVVTLRVDHPVAEVAPIGAVPAAVAHQAARLEALAVVQVEAVPLVDHPAVDLAVAALIEAAPVAAVAQAVDLEAEARLAVVAVIGEAPADLAALPVAVVHRVGAALPVEAVAVDQVHQAEAEAEAAHKSS